MTVEDWFIKLHLKNNGETLKGFSNVAVVLLLISLLVEILLIQSASCNIIDEDIINMHLIGVDNYMRIHEISCLEDGWDGDRASAIPSKVIDRVKELLIVLPSGAKIFPTGRKSVQIEYHKAEDDFFELEISSDTYSVYSVKGEEEFEGDVRKRDIKKKVESFLK